MVATDFRRRLAAILCADVVGYTRLMAADESGTHAAYKACLADIVTPAVERHRGRIVKSTGDGFVAVFDSVVDGLACAVLIQDGVAKRGTAGTAGPRLDFRIGVNLGDVIIEEADVYGDGVNIAARLQALAAPGGVCVSALVRDEIRGKLPIEFDSLGPKRVKRTDEPLHAYAVRGYPAAGRRTFASSLPGPLRAVLRRKRVSAFVAAAVICASALAAWQFELLPPHSVSDLLVDDKPRFALPNVPSLVVLPFKIISASDDQEYFADGITEDIITDLARIRGLFVIARASSFSYKSKPVDVRKVGRELGVRYALDGSVRKAGDTVRINAQLIDAQTGGHVWADRFDKPLDDIFKIQDEITQNIVKVLSVKVGESERTRTSLAQTSSMAAYDAFLRGWAHYRHNSSTDYQKAIQYFEDAIALDPNFAQAHAAIAAAHLAARMFSWTNVEEFSSPLQTVLNARMHEEELLETARQHLASALRNPTSLAYRVAAEILIFERKHDEAIGQIRKAIALDPNDADNFAALSAALVWASKGAEAIEPIERAIRLNPFHPPIYLCHYGTALFSLRRYDEAADRFEQCAAGNPNNHWPYIYLVAAHAYLGQDAKAAEAHDKLAELLRRQQRSPFTVKEARSRIPYRYDQDMLHLLVGLHRGNIPNTLVPEQ